MSHNGTTITSPTTSRRDFLRKSGALALLTALPGKLLADTTVAATRQPGCNNAPILLELSRINDLPDSKTVTEGFANIFTSPEMISLPSYCLNTDASILSGFQKDVLNTYLTLAANPLTLKRYLTGAITPDTLALRGILASSPSYLTCIAAAAEIKKISALTSQINTGIQEFISGLSTSPTALTGTTGVPALDTVLAKIYTLSQTTAYTNVAHALLAIAQRDDFPAFVMGLDLPDLLRFIPYDTKIGLQLPIDTPDNEAVIIGIIAALIIYNMFAASINAFVIALFQRVTQAAANLIPNANGGEPGGGEGPPGNGVPDV